MEVSQADAMEEQSGRQFWAFATEYNDGISLIKREVKAGESRWMLRKWMAQCAGGSHISK